MPKRNRTDVDCDMSDGSTISIKKTFRTPQACNNCRRRKSKCDGCRPCCRNCRRLRDSCTWSALPYDIESLNGQTIPTAVPVDTLVVSSNAFPKPAMVQRLLDRFYRLHLDVEFCSFLHRHSFDHRQPQSPFLIASIITLSSLYISDEEAMQDFGFSTAADLSKYYLIKARGYSKDLSQAPCVLNIQSNLILSLCEHLSWNESRAFMSAGLAIRMALAMRLGREYNSSLSIREQEIRRRTFWSCYIMDRLVSFSGGRMHAIDLQYVNLQLPCPENIFAFEEPYVGPRLEDLLSGDADNRHLDVLPFFIITMTLWSEMEDYWLIVGREAKLPPSDPNSKFYKAEKALETWQSRLPKRMKWSDINYKLHKNLGQGKVFVTMHFLLFHGMVLGNSQYLPELDTPTEPLDGFDGAGLSMYYHDERLITNCLKSVQAITEIATLLYDGDDQDKENLRSSIAASALVFSAAVHLWSHHVGNLQGNIQCINLLAMSQFDYLLCIIASWRPFWAVEKAWAETLDMLTRLYNSAYSGHPDLDLTYEDIDDEESRKGIPEETSAAQSSTIETFHTASVGNGIEDPRKVRQRMHDKVRLTLGMAMVSSENRVKLRRGFLGTLWQHISPSDLFATPPDAFAGFETTPVTFTDFLVEDR